MTRYQPWFDNARRLKDLVAKLEIASVHAVEQAEKTHQGRSGGQVVVGRLLRRLPTAGIFTVRRGRPLRGKGLGLY